MSDTSPHTANQTQGPPAPPAELVPVHTGLPALPPALPPYSPRRRRWPVLVMLALAAIGGGGVWWWQHRLPPLPAGITFSNGRLEADEIDIATKFAGRISQILADEGDHVIQGQVVARIDTRDLEASLAQAEAQVAQARHTITQSQEELVQDGSQVKLAAQELDRARTLVLNDFESREVLDQRQATFDAATATYRGAQAKIAAATAAMEAAIHSADLIRVNIADNMLVAPKDGPIQHRLANVGEVLAAGGKVFTMLDETYVYMDVFLPSGAAGQARLGDEARIVLDGQPNRPVPATVSFIASQNQFTPKMVETKDERDKLMFRVRLRINADWLKAHPGSAHSGEPGLGYVRLDPKATWPAALQPAGES